VRCSGPLPTGTFGWHTNGSKHAVSPLSVPTASRAIRAHGVPHGPLHGYGSWLCDVHGKARAPHMARPWICPQQWVNILARSWPNVHVLFVHGDQCATLSQKLRPFDGVLGCTLFLVYAREAFTWCSRALPEVTLARARLRAREKRRKERDAQSETRARPRISRKTKKDVC
jgi:hypothetical protein